MTLKRNLTVDGQDDHFKQNKKVYSYLSNNLIPAIKDNAAVWVLRTAHMMNPSLGITNNVSESFNGNRFHLMISLCHFICFHVIIVKLYT